VAILVIDDDAGLRRAVKRVLVAQGFDVDVAGGGDEALARLRQGSYDLVVLDVMMPGSDGIQVCEQLRAVGDRLPALMLTATDAVRDRVAGLEASADDCLLKPFANEELVAPPAWPSRRVRARVRTGDGEHASECQHWEAFRTLAEAGP
jgi:two-component system response regulator MprA